MSTYLVRWIEEHRVTVEADDGDRAQTVAVTTKCDVNDPTLWNRGMFNATQVTDDAVVVDHDDPPPTRKDVNDE
jgi:hypothetical protein